MDNNKVMTYIRKEVKRIVDHNGFPESVILGRDLAMKHFGHCNFKNVKLQGWTIPIIYTDDELFCVAGGSMKFDSSEFIPERRGK